MCVSAWCRILAGTEKRLVGRPPEHIDVYATMQYGSAPSGLVAQLKAEPSSGVQRAIRDGVRRVVEDTVVGFTPPKIRLQVPMMI